MVECRHKELLLKDPIKELLLKDPLKELLLKGSSDPFFVKVRWVNSSTHGRKLGAVLGRLGERLGGSWRVLLAS